MKGVKIALGVALMAVIALASSDFSQDAQQDLIKPGAGSQHAPTPQPPGVKRNSNPERIANGKRLFQEFCFMCHGRSGEGDPDWKTPDEDGKYPAPPLNGTGHAWHHPMKFLHDYIKNGSMDKGGSMMGFEGGMSDKDITDVILFVQSKWPDELYDSWYRRDLKSKE